LVRTALRHSATVYNRVAEYLDHEDYGVVSDNLDIERGIYNPLVPLTESDTRYYWLLYGSDITKYNIIEHDKMNPLLSKLKGDHTQYNSLKDIFEDWASTEPSTAKYDLRSQRYPPRIETLNEIIEQEKKVQSRRLRQSRGLESTKRLFSHSDETTKYSKSGRPMRQTTLNRVAANATDEPLSRAERYANRNSKQRSNSDLPEDESAKIEPPVVATVPAVVERKKETDLYLPEEISASPDVLPSSEESSSEDYMAPHKRGRRPKVEPTVWKSARLAAKHSTRLNKTSDAEVSEHQS